MAIGRIPFEPVLLAATSSVESRQGLYSAFDRPEIDPSPVTDIGKIVETQNTQSVGIDVFQFTIEIDQHDTLGGLVEDPSQDVVRLIGEFGHEQIGHSPAPYESQGITIIRQNPRVFPLKQGFRNRRDLACPTGWASGMIAYRGETALEDRVLQP